MKKAHAECHNPQIPAEILLLSCPNPKKSHLVAARAVAESSAAALGSLGLGNGDNVDGDRVELLMDTC